MSTSFEEIKKIIVHWGNVHNIKDVDSFSFLNDVSLRLYEIISKIDKEECDGCDSINEVGEDVEKLEEERDKLQEKLEKAQEEIKEWEDIEEIIGKAQIKIKAVV